MRGARRLILILLPCLIAAFRADAWPGDVVAAPPEPSSTVSVRFHLSEEASFLHFVDSLSRWSPYCAPVDHSYLGIPRLGESDGVWLQRYAAARRPMGDAAETDLLLWAESGFPLGRSPGHTELRAAVDHFRGIPGFRDPLLRRMKELRCLRPSLDAEVARLEAELKTLRGVVDVFTTEETKRPTEVPVFVMYNLKPRSFGGGANGEGIFVEVDLSASSPELPRSAHLLHEYLHLALRPRGHLRAFTASSPERKPWQQALSGTAPDEKGDDEASMLDEILIYALANVVVGGRDPQGEMQNYARGGDKQMVRLWDGVRLLLPLVRRQLEEPLPSQEFLPRLIGAFVSKVYYPVWSCPDGITIAKPPTR